MDNDFARKAVAIMSEPPFSGLAPSRLCDRCLGLDFWKPGFRIADFVGELEERSRRCDLCNMLWQTCRKFKGDKRSTVVFERSQSNLLVNGLDYPPALSIFHSRGKNVSGIPPRYLVTASGLAYKKDPAGLHTPFPIQLGLPKLPECTSDSFLSIVKCWVEDCDNNHRECRNQAQGGLPTRLIDVATGDASAVHLCETKPGEKGRYVALSHPWGDSKIHPPFRTLRSNYDKLLNEGIPFDDLPQTFQDAVKTTRGLGIRYLWIDSICIIQGPDGDFNSQAPLMEDVFSSAYCVIAASRAKGQCDGFLKPRNQRDVVTMQRQGEVPFYICPVIDDFATDVLDGHLNTRAWVLQERALAKRTIFFTETQTYWECGIGVRCETFTKMKK